MRWWWCDSSCCLNQDLQRYKKKRHREHSCGCLSEEDHCQSFATYLMCNDSFPLILYVSPDRSKISKTYEKAFQSIQILFKGSSATWLVLKLLYRSKAYHILTALLYCHLYVWVTTMFAWRTAELMIIKTERQVWQSALWYILHLFSLNKAQSQFQSQLIWCRCIFDGYSRLSRPNRYFHYGLTWFSFPRFAENITSHFAWAQGDIFKSCFVQTPVKNSKIFSLLKERKKSSGLSKDQAFLQLINYQYSCCFIYSWQIN